MATVNTAVNIAKTSRGKIREWVVIIPDHANVLARRIAIRPQHSPNFVRLHNEGYVSWAGPLFQRHVTSGQRPFKGSAIVLNDVDKESILARLAGDVYIKENIWDVDNAVIMPFRTLIRKGL
ncbi:hypothetical protein ESCO_003772 [Escovopsis weberi]|uniref:YCII-related domain-containing protein n=1 Tax=Escovopsis weberi TaxID=150374 RepID=A0A0M9VXC5_ESCWE|nr:hypothetical protein ESCO_003772 [Escovopsis weberi]